MSGNVFGELLTQLCELNRDLVRNIKNIRTAQNLLDDLSTDASDWPAGETAISRSRPLASVQDSIIQRPFDFDTVITFPFLDRNWQATRFSDGLRFGVWYGSFTIKTTIYETVYHWLRFIEDSFPDEPTVIVGERRVFDTKVKGLVADLREREHAYPALTNADDYRFCQQLGHYAENQRINGLIVRSARCEGINTAMFNAALLSQVRDRCYLTYHYQPGDAQVRIEREPEKRYLSIARAALID